VEDLNSETIMLEQYNLKKEVWDMDLPHLIDEVGFIMSESPQIDEDVEIIILRFFKTGGLVLNDIDHLKRYYILTYSQFGFRV